MTPADNAPGNRTDRRAARTAARRGLAARIVTPLAAAGAALTVVGMTTPPRQLLSAPFRDVLARDSAAFAPTIDVAPLRNAFGKSGGVNVRFALPNDTVTYPVELTGARRPVAYEWVRLDNSALAVGRPRALAGATLIAPAEPGFYHLALVSGDVRRVIDGPALAVKVPFARKLGSVLNGYRIGTYLAERLGRGEHDRPDGFVEITPDKVDLPLTKHFRLGDFLTHDAQESWPRYAAVSPKLLDKLELVVAEIARVQGRDPALSVAVEMSSGFRTPLYNRRVRWSAGDSRHQYGDAADVRIDANFDGRFTATDARLVALAAEMVERRHPELAGGIGLYTSRRYATPYVHIDTRGKKARWRS